MHIDDQICHRYWGKLDDKKRGLDQPYYHLLVYHSLDVAAVMHQFLHLKHTLTADMADFLAIDKKTFIRLCTLTAALHDLGKFAAAFQCLNPYPTEGLQSIKAMYPYDASNAHHDRLGGYFWMYLEEQVLTRLPDWVESSNREKSKAKRNFWILMECALGHHGKPINRQQLELLGPKYTVPHDLQAASEFLLEVMSLPDLHPNDLTVATLINGSFAQHAKQLSWTFAGAMVLSDWLGSNRDYFPYESRPMDLASYWPLALSRAANALEHTELADIPRVTPFQSIEHHFRFSPSPLQHWAQTVEVDDSPQLFILEDVTGAGKTEAALALTHRLLQAGAGDGFYFGLPTMATSNAMFNRVADYYQQMLRKPDGSVPSIVLAHGARDMHPSFQQLLPVHQQESLGYAISDDTATMRCNQWLADSRKKALLSPVGVGTIDQALMAVLPRKHQSLRLLGLGRKILVFDEVHAADAYMLELLEALLTFHVQHGGSAILLTATLPYQQRLRLVNIWQKVLHAPVDKLKCLQFPLATSVNLYRPNQIEEQPLACRPGAERQVKVQFVHRLEDCVQKLLETLSKGQCAVWIRNTVAEAIQAYQVISQQVADPSQCILFHSRFVLADRLSIEAQVLECFGKESNVQLRSGRLLIATQVFQESLDADADFMISDLCPIDDLIQRAGRLHRHVRDSLGNRLRVGGADTRGTPTLWVHAPEWQSEPTQDWLRSAGFAGTQAVYQAPGRLWLGMRKLRELGGWRLPEHARELIEAVYGEQAQDDIPSALAQAEFVLDGKNRSKEAAARANVVNWEYGYSMAGRQNWYEDELDISTRFSDREIRNVVVVRHTAQELRPWVDDPVFAWELSTVRLAEKGYASRLPCLPEWAQAQWDLLTQRHRKLRFIQPWLLEQESDLTYDSEFGVYEKSPL